MKQRLRSKRVAFQSWPHNGRFHLTSALITPLAGASGAPSRGCAPDALAGEAGVMPLSLSGGILWS